MWVRIPPEGPIKVKCASIAQLAEQLTCNQLVGGSIPPAGSIYELSLCRPTEESEDSKSLKCGFESHQRDHFKILDSNSKY